MQQQPRSRQDKGRAAFEYGGAGKRPGRQDFPVIISFASQAYRTAIPRGRVLAGPLAITAGDPLFPSLAGTRRVKDSSGDENRGPEVSQGANSIARYHLTRISHHLVCGKVGIRGERGAGGHRLPATRRRLDRATKGFEPVRQHERRRVPRPKNPNSRLGPRARIYKDGCSDRVY